MQSGDIVGTVCLSVHPACCLALGSGCSRARATGDVPSGLCLCWGRRHLCPCSGSPRCRATAATPSRVYPDLRVCLITALHLGIIDSLR